MPDLAQTKEHGFQARSAGEWARLRRAQAELEAETGNAAFLGLSLAATLAQCVRLGNHRAAARLRADFKVSDRRFWWLKARALLLVMLCCVNGVLCRTLVSVVHCMTPG